jgi:hypothetical protein
MGKTVYIKGADGKMQGSRTLDGKTPPPAQDNALSEMNVVRPLDDAMSQAAAERAKAMEIVRKLQERSKEAAKPGEPVGQPTLTDEEVATLERYLDDSPAKKPDWSWDGDAQTGSGITTSSTYDDGRI